MKIAFFVNQTFSEIGGGIGPFGTRVLAGLKQYSLNPKIELSVVGGSQVPAPYIFPEKKWYQKRAPQPYQLPYEFDLLHVPYQVPPTFDVPFICTMHDVQDLHFPEFFSPEDREWRAINYRKSINDAKRIVVSYAHVKKDLIRFFRCDPNKVVIIPPPVDYSTPTEMTISPLGGLDPAKPFLLYPAQTWPHKNHIGLIQAIEVLKQRREYEINLVCTGVCNDYFQVINDYLDQSSVAPQVRFLGMVDQKELTWLYRHAHAVVIPTLYEAGSFPLVEAMAFATPVVCANTTSLPDMINDDRFVFDPSSPEAIADSVHKISTDQQLRQANMANSRLQTELLQKSSFVEHYERMWLDVINEQPMTEAA